MLKSEIEDSNDLSYKLIKTEYIMWVYKKLFTVQESTSYLLFPLGIISYPSDLTTSKNYTNQLKDRIDQCIDKHFSHKLIHREYLPYTPLIVFDNLDETWKQLTIRPTQFADSFIGSLLLLL